MQVRAVLDLLLRSSIVRNAPFTASRDGRSMRRYRAGIASNIGRQWSGGLLTGMALRLNQPSFANSLITRIALLITLAPAVFAAGS